MTQADVAKASGMTQSAIACLEALSGPEQNREMVQRYIERVRVIPNLGRLSSNRVGASKLRVTENDNYVIFIYPDKRLVHVQCKGIVAQTDVSAHPAALARFRTTPP